MWRKIDRYVEENRMIAEGDGVLLGLSGGADSICLARCLLRHRDAGRIRLLAVHVNHMLRDRESAGDEQFVARFCEEYRIPLEIVRVPVAEEAKSRRCSVEEAGRMVRYEQFRRIASGKDCARIAVAHHQGDQAETVLLNQIRGTGYRGLAGMKPVEGSIIRPLLGVSREDILAILERLGQAYREDSSNASLQYQRNYIRHTILPDMETLNPAVREHLAGMAQRMGELESYLEPMLEEAYRSMAQEYLAGTEGDSGRGDSFLKPQGVLLRSELRGRPVFERMEVIRRGMARLAGGEKDIGALHLRTIDELLYNKEGKRNDLPGGIAALRISSGVLLFPADEARDPAGRERLRQMKAFTGEDESLIPGPDRAKAESLREDIPGLPDERNPHVVFVGKKIRADLYCLEGKHLRSGKIDCEICIDYDKINGNLTFRNRCPGDYIICDNQGHRKLLKRYFIDSKIPAPERSRCLLLAEGSRVLWIGTGRVSEDCKVTGRTKRVLAIHFR